MFIYELMYIVMGSIAIYLGGGLVLLGLAHLVPDSWSKKKPDKKKNILDNPKCYDI